MTRLIVLLVWLLAAHPFRPAHASGLLIIANPAAGEVGPLSSDAVSAIYLLRVTAWPNGTHIVPVNRELGSPLRTAFTAHILGQDMASLSAYWNEMHFKGQMPPVIQQSETALVAFVQRVPGAIGYIEAAVAPPGVRVIGRFANVSDTPPAP